jgi:hypothetical protein
MSETTEFLGVIFRSQGHLNYFKLSGGFFVINIIMFFCHKVLTLNKVGFEKLLLPLFRYFYLIHFAASVVALFVSKLGTDNGPKFSIDCVWYNFVLGAIYYVLYKSLNK